MRNVVLIACGIATAVTLVITPNSLAGTVITRTCSSPGVNNGITYQSPGTGTVTAQFTSLRTAYSEGEQVSAYLTISGGYTTTETGGPYKYEPRNVRFFLDGQDISRGHSYTSFPATLGEHVLSVSFDLAMAGLPSLPVWIPAIGTCFPTDLTFSDTFSVAMPTSSPQPQPTQTTSPAATDAETPDRQMTLTAGKAIVRRVAIQLGLKSPRVGWCERELKNLVSCTALSRQRGKWRQQRISVFYAGPHGPFYDLPDISRIVSNRIGAVCRDGWTSTATYSGACSHHRGVWYWLYG